MAMNRCLAWSHPNGAEASVATLADVLGQHIRAIVDANVSIYPTNDFKTGICNNSLLQWIPLLKLLVDVDPRGGIFNQRHMSDALETATKANYLHDRMCSAAIATQRPVDEVYTLTAYRMRVMLSHLRIKFDGATARPNEFSDIFDVMRRPDSSKRQRRMERVAQENPFINFRQSSPGPEETDDAQTEQVVVTKYFDGKQVVALTQYGSLWAADHFETRSKSLRSCILEGRRRSQIRDRGLRYEPMIYDLCVLCTRFHMSFYHCS